MKSFKFRSVISKITPQKKIIIISVIFILLATSAVLVYSFLMGGSSESEETRSSTTEIEEVGSSEPVDEDRLVSQVESSINSGDYDSLGLLLQDDSNLVLFEEDVNHFPTVHAFLAYLEDQLGNQGHSYVFSNNNTYLDVKLSEIEDDSILYEENKDTVFVGIQEESDIVLILIVDENGIEYFLVLNLSVSQENEEEDQSVSDLDESKVSIIVVLGVTEWILGEEQEISVKMYTRNIGLEMCKLKWHQDYEGPGGVVDTILPSKAEQRVFLKEGWHYFIMTCKKDGIVYENGWDVFVRLPDLSKCDDITVDHDENFVMSLEDIKSNLVGTWYGCVDNPWTDHYYVSVAFNSDGTYDTDNLEESSHSAMYWGEDYTSPLNTYKIVEIDSRGYARGDIVTNHSSGSSWDLTIENLKMSGNGTIIKFNVFGEKGSGPLEFELVKDPSSL